ncbi:MAG: hypothetical protein L6V92_08420 [Phocaeicola vulgatus]|nr:MAG: hypothetical protein L6V92_08420 [Phocaeicola vulgatus]
MEKTLIETRAGVAASNVDDVCSFLNDALLQWQKDGYTSSAIRTETIEQYSRKGQAQQFIQLFNRYKSSSL